MPRKPRTDGRTCDHCDRELYAVGMCSRHYHRNRKYGDPLHTPVKRDRKRIPQALRHIPVHRLARWAREGYLDAPLNNNKREWTGTEIAVAVRMFELVEQVGMPPRKAAKVAREMAAGRDFLQALGASNG